MQTILKSGIKIWKGRNNRVYRDHRYHYMTRNSIFGIACGVDGEIKTAWHRTYSDAAKSFREGVDDILNNQK